MFDTLELIMDNNYRIPKGCKRYCIITNKNIVVVALNLKNAARKLGVKKAFIKEV